MLVPFLETAFTIIKIALAKNGMSLNRIMHFIRININSLLPKIDEVRYIENITNASIIATKRLS